MKGAMATWYHGNPNKTTDYKKNITMVEGK